MISLLLIMAAATAEPSQHSVAQPIGKPSRWIAEADYPVAALNDRSEGVVGYRLTVSAEGRATGCNIVQSSGVATLDSATCGILVRRAKFKRATSSGHRSYKGKIRWMAPELNAGSSGSVIASLFRDEEDFMGFDH